MSEKEGKRAGFSGMSKKSALEQIAESAAFWESVFNEEALLASTGERPYANPWFPVEFARNIRELAEVALESKNHEKISQV